MKFLQFISIISVLALTWCVSRLLESSDCIQVSNLNQVVFTEHSGTQSFERCGLFRILRFKTVAPEELKQIENLFADIKQFERTYLKHTSWANIPAQTLIIYKDQKNLKNFTSQYIHMSQDLILSNPIPFIIKARLTAINPLLTYDKKKLNLYANFYEQLSRGITKTSYEPDNLSFLLRLYYKNLAPLNRIEFLERMSKSLSPSFELFVLQENLNKDLETTKIELNYFLSKIYGPNKFSWEKFSKLKITRSIKLKNAKIRNLVIRLKDLASKKQPLEQNIINDIKKSSITKKWTSVILLSCKSPTFNQITKLQIHKDQNPFWIESCDAKTHTLKNKLATHNLDIFLSKNQKINFIKFHIPSILTAQKYNYIKSNDLVTNPSVHKQLRWTQPKALKKYAAAFSPMAEIEAITAFRGI